MEFNILVPLQSSPGDRLFFLTHWCQSQPWDGLWPVGWVHVTSADTWTASLWLSLIACTSAIDHERISPRQPLAQNEELYRADPRWWDHPTAWNQAKRIQQSPAEPQPPCRPGRKHRLFQAKIWGRCVCYTAWLQVCLTDIDGKTKVSALPPLFRKLSPKRQPTLDCESSVTASVCHSSPCP